MYGAALSYERNMQKTPFIQEIRIPNLVVEKFHTNRKRRNFYKTLSQALDFEYNSTKGGCYKKYVDQS